MTRPKKPPTPPEESGTVRQQIRALLEEGPLTALEISSAIRRPEKEIAGHLEHLQKSLHSEGRRLVQVPAECRVCGFVFRKRGRFQAPGRCPVCRGESISDPSFRLEAGPD
ncbi:MAG: transcriptional regulator [bacterium]